MGAYSTAIHPETGEHVEFMGGGRSRHTYRVGDVVDWRINREWVGHGKLLDDVYDGRVVSATCDEPPSTERAWVVIKDHVLAAILPIPDGVEDPWASYDDLREDFGIQDPDPDLWSDVAWTVHRKRHRKTDAQWWWFVRSLFRGRPTYLPDDDGHEDLQSGAA